MVLLRLDPSVDANSMYEQRRLRKFDTVPNCLAFPDPYRVPVMITIGRSYNQRSRGPFTKIPLTIRMVRYDVLELTSP